MRTPTLEIHELVIEAHVRPAAEGPAAGGQRAGGRMSAQAATAARDGTRLFQHPDEHAALIEAVARLVIRKLREEREL